MRPFALPLVLLAAGLACSPGTAGPVVLAPSAVAGSPAAEGQRPAARAGPRGEGKLAACALPWTLEDLVGGPGHVNVVCASDVRREELQPGPMTQAIDPALEPARERVCSCADRLPVPASADLVVRSSPDDGVATVETVDVDEDLDPEVGRPFYECIGKLQIKFAPLHPGACDGGKTVYVYTWNVDLAQ